MLGVCQCLFGLDFDTVNGDNVNLMPVMGLTGAKFGNIVQLLSK